MLHDAGQIAERAVRLATKGEVEAVDGTVLRIEPHSLCLHGDTPGSIATADRDPCGPGGGRRRAGELRLNALSPEPRALNCGPAGRSRTGTGRDAPVS